MNWEQPDPQQSWSCIRARALYLPEMEQNRTLDWFTLHLVTEYLWPTPASPLRRWRFTCCVWSPSEQIVTFMQPNGDGGGCKGVIASKMPLHVFKFILPLSKPTPLAFLPIANLSKLRCKTSAVGELKHECQAFESSTEKWGFYSWNARGGVGWEWKRSDILVVAEAKPP